MNVVLLDIGAVAFFVWRHTTDLLEPIDVFFALFSPLFDKGVCLEFLLYTRMSR